MNKSISDLCSKYAINITKIKMFNKYIIVYDGDDKYLLKDKNSSLQELFDYFHSINFKYYLEPINGFGDSYEIYNYYDDLNDDISNKCNKMAEVLSYLHFNSTVVENNKQYCDYLYKSVTSKIDYLMDYYLDLQDYIERFSFPRIDYHYLIVNISSFYKMINIAKENIDNWYNDNNYEIRKSITIGNVSHSNFRINEISYFIDFDNCKRDYFICDLVSLFKNENINNLNSIFSLYNTNNLLTKYEIKLFYSLICIPSKIELTSNVYDNILLIKRALDYNDKVFEFLLEKNKENQETNESKFKE